MLGEPMLLVGPLVAAALVGGIEVGAVLAAEAQRELLALGVEFRRPGKPHASSIVGLSAGVNLLCSAASWTLRITSYARSIANGTFASPRS